MSTEKRKQNTSQSYFGDSEYIHVIGLGLGVTLFRGRLVSAIHCLLLPLAHFLICDICGLLCGSLGRMQGALRRICQYSVV